MEYSEQEWSDLKQTISLVFVVFLSIQFLKNALTIHAILFACKTECLTCFNSQMNNNFQTNGS